MQVKDIMITKIITVPETATYEEAAQILVSNRIGGAPVIDGHGSLLGIISKKDLFKVLYPFYRSFYEHPENYAQTEQLEDKAGEIRKHKIIDYMSKGVITVESDVPIISAGAIMLARQIHRLPVVENNQLVGLVTREDVFEAVLKHNFSFIE